jgi:hypothetical protein
MAKYAARCLGVHFVIICRVWVCHFVCRMRDTFFFLPCCLPSVRVIQAGVGFMVVQCNGSVAFDDMRFRR